MSDFQFLRWDPGTVTTVWLARPPVNAINQEMYAEITRFFSSLDTYAPDASAIILRGEGKYFCAGNDLADFQTMNPENAGERLGAIRDASFAIYDAAVPVIAAVQGVAVGSGLVLAASCDLVVAATGARFGLPEVSVGVMGGAKHASRLVPQGMVRYLHLTGDWLPAEDFVKFGGILEVVAPEELEAKAHALAERIVRHSPVVLRYAKKSLNTIEYEDFKTGFQTEQKLSGELSAFDDSKEAVNAYFEGRTPHYTGT